MKLSYYTFTILLCTLSFVYYFHDITSDYFQYRTNTSVNYRKIAQFSYLFSVTYPKNTFNELDEEIISNRLTINGKRIQVDTITKQSGKSIYGQELEIYDVTFKNLFQYGEDFVFILSHKKEDQFWPEATKITVFNHRDDNKTDIVTNASLSSAEYRHVAGLYVTIVSLLEAPYDTGCVRSVGVSTSSRNKSCVSYDTFPYIAEVSVIIGSNDKSIAISNSMNVQMESIPAISTTRYIFYSLGLLSIFAEFSILTSLIDIGKFVSRKLCNITVVNYRFLVFSSVLALCAFHIYYVTRNYLNYDHESQTYLGGPIKITLPQIVLCTDGENLGELISKPIFPLIHSIEETIPFYEPLRWKSASNNFTCHRLQTPNVALSAESLATTDQIMKLNMKYKPDKIILFFASAHAFTIFENSTVSPSYGGKAEKMSSNGGTGEETPHDEAEKLPSGGRRKSKEEPPREPRMKVGFLVSSMYGKNFEVATSFNEITLLPAPFHTRCLNYEKFNYTHDYCVDSCTNITRNEKYCTERVCGPQCHRIVWFSLSSTRESETVLNFPEYARVVKLVPRIDGVDFVAEILSILSFWTGICVFISIIDILIYILQRLRNSAAVFKPIMYIFLLVGLGFHAYIIIANYLQYNMVSNVSYQIPEFIPYPKVTLIIDDYSKTDDVKRARKFISPKELIQNYIPVSDLILNVSIVHPKEDKRLILDPSQMDSLIQNSRQYAYSHYQLLTLDFESYKNGAKILDLNDRQTPFLLSFYIENSLKGDSSRYTYKMQVHYDDIALYDDFKSFSIKPSHLSISPMVTQLLASPFETKCINYEDAFTSKNSWYDCLLRKCNETFPYDLVLRSNVTRMRHEPMKKDRRMKNRCIKKFRLHSPCSRYNIEYNNYAHGTPIMRKGPSDIVINLYMASQITCTLYPKTTTIQLMIILGGVTGTWLGVNLFTLLMKAPNLAPSFKRFKKSQRPMKSQRQKFFTSVRSDVNNKRRQHGATRRFYHDRHLRRHIWRSEFYDERPNDKFYLGEKIRENFNKTHDSNRRSYIRRRMEARQLYEAYLFQHRLNQIYI